MQNVWAQTCAKTLPCTNVPETISQSYSCIIRSILRKYKIEVHVEYHITTGITWKITYARSYESRGSWCMYTSYMTRVYSAFTFIAQLLSNIHYSTCTDITLTIQWTARQTNTGWYFQVHMLDLRHNIMLVFSALIGCQLVNTQARTRALSYPPFPSDSRCRRRWRRLSWRGWCSPGQRPPVGCDAPGTDCCRSVTASLPECQWNPLNLAPKLPSFIE